jgi:hypothetical protein
MIKVIEEETDPELALKTSVGLSPRLIGYAKEQDPLSEARSGPGGYNWENLTEKGRFLEANNTIMSELQKRYWIRERLANAMTANENDLKVHQLLEIHFYRKIQDLETGGSGGSSGVGTASVYPPARFLSGYLPIVGTGSPVLQSEPYLPGDVGRTLTFAVALLLPASKAPLFIQRFLDPKTEPAMLIHPLATRIYLVAQNEPEVFKTSEAGKKAQVIQEEEATLQAAPALLAMTCQLIDIDPQKLGEIDSALKAATKH